MLILIPITILPKYPYHAGIGICMIMIPIPVLSISLTLITFRRLVSILIYDIYSNRSTFKYYISILGGGV